MQGGAPRSVDAPPYALRATPHVAPRRSESVAALLSSPMLDLLFLAEHRRREREDLASGLPPRARRQAGLATGLVEEPFAVPAALGRDLRQQQAAAPSQRMTRPWTPTSTASGAIGRRSPSTETCRLSVGQLGRQRRIEAAVVHGGGHGRARHRLVEAVERLGHADASARARRSRRRVSVTNAPRRRSSSARSSPRSSSARDSPRSWPSMARRASASRWRCARSGEAVGAHAAAAALSAAAR